MANFLELNQSVTFTGPDTYSYVATADGTYLVQAACTIPCTSTLQLDIQVNGGSWAGPIGGGPGAMGPALGYTVPVVVNAGDTISVVVSNASDADSLPNAVKGTITLSQTAQL